MDADEIDRKNFDDKAKILMAAIKDQFPDSDFILIVDNCKDGQPMLVTSLEPQEAAQAMHHTARMMSSSLNLDEATNNVYFGSESDTKH